MLRNPPDLKHAGSDSVEPDRACGWVCISNEFHGDARLPATDHSVSVEVSAMTSSLGVGSGWV